MARTVRDANLETRAARERLKARAEPYWRAVDPGAHIGYYRGKRGGSWVARLYRGPGYDKTTLGTADKVTDADGIAVLSYRQALEKARLWFADEARRKVGLEPGTGGGGRYTVADTLRDYLAWYADHRRALASTETSVNAHILPALGDIDVAKLTPAAIRKWLTDLAKAPARLRRGRGREVRHRAAPVNAEARRRRQATANRVLTVLKAALNHAWREGKVASDEAWRKVKPFRDVDAPVVRYLTEAEWARLVNACAPDFRRLVCAALLTGCRYGELIALVVTDFNPDAGTVTVRASKSGKARHVVLTEEGQHFFLDATAGQASGDLVFRRDRGGAWGKSHQSRRMAEACEVARITPAVAFHVLRHTHGSQLAMRGVPLPVIAKQLGHADTRMTERHYAHLSPSYVADTIRARFPTLGVVKAGKVATIKTRAR